MKLKLVRTVCGNRTTVGQLYVNGVQECFVLEDQDRQLEINPEAKVYGETCIPRGTYKVIITYSNRFKRELPLLVDVPGFEGIRIHPGNSHVDTHGCLLPVTSVTPDGQTGINSRNAFHLLYQKIESALEADEDVTIEIV